MIEGTPAGFQLAVSAVLGAVVGSFLNVCIHRLPSGASIVWPASACPACRRTLAWHENVPIVSYLVLRGRCRTCGTPISPGYPIVEALTAATFSMAWWQYGPGALLASRITFACLLIVLFSIDLEHHLLPDALTLPGIAGGFAFSFFTAPGWAASLTGLLVGGGVLFGIAEIYFRLRHEEGLGMGDVKMLSMIGAFLGWKLMLLTLILASFAGALVGVGILVTGRGGMKYALPFGTFLALGAAAAATVGQAIVDWYAGWL
jgi:leader peptidase (prepilin peptidase)/N-methyltransferase